MKRLLGLMLLMVVLVGCGEANAPPAESSPTTAESVAVLEKLGAKLYRNGQGEIVNVNLSNKKDVIDAALVHLTGLTSLTYLGLSDTQVTRAGVAELKKALPNCRISSGGRRR